VIQGETTMAASLANQSPGLISIKAVDWFVRHVCSGSNICLHAVFP
jgi:hypothetical protein